MTSLSCVLHCNPEASAVEAEQHHHKPLTNRLPEARPVCSSSSNMQCVTQSRAIARAAPAFPRRLAPSLLRGAVHKLRFKERDEMEEQRELDVMSEELRKGLPKNLADVQRMMQATGRGKTRNLAPSPGLLQPAFTRPREIGVGRIAMVGFFAACLWETILPGHPGILMQLYTATGVLPSTWATGLLVLVTWNVIGALAPWSPTYSQFNLLDAAQRPLGPPAVWVNPFTDFKRFFGITGWGFTKANELFHGRLAMIGFAAALVQEGRLGGVGPLALVAHYLGVEASDAYYSAMSSGFWAFAAFAIALAVVHNRMGTMETDSEADIY